MQRVTGDVDFRIMGTFVEFYTTLLGFVNYRLYTSIGLVYPPRFDVSSDERGGELGAITLEGNGVGTLGTVEGQNKPSADGVQEKGPDAENNAIQKHADELAQHPEPAMDNEQDQNLVDEAPIDTIDTFEVQGEGADVLDQPRQSDLEAGSLFAPYSFFLSRETPRQPLEFILRAFGCKYVSWDEVLGDGAFTHDEHDPSITHQVVDRPPIIQPDVFTSGDSGLVSKSSSGGRMPGRTYIQPQWIWDCVNQSKLLRPDLYAPGATLPPHLSPWVKPMKSAYDPTVPLEEQEIDGEGKLEGGSDKDEEDEIQGLKVGDDDQAMAGLDEEVDAVDDHGMDVAGADSDDHSVDEEFGGFDSDDARDKDRDTRDDDPNDNEMEHQRELEAEAAGLAYTASASPRSNVQGAKNSRTKITEAKKKAAKKRQEEEEELERRKMMMSKKKRKLYEKMSYSNQAKDAEAARLSGKRRKLEIAKGR